MSNWPLRSVLIWLPILGGALVLAVGNARAGAARWLGLAVAVLTFVFSIGLLIGFDPLQPERFQQTPHPGIAAQVGDAQIGVGVDLGAACVEVFVLRIEQIEQGALADIELVTVSGTGFLDQADLTDDERQLLVQPFGFVVGNLQGLAPVAAGFFAQIERHVLAFAELAVARRVRTAVEQVVVEAQLDAAFIA